MAANRTLLERLFTRTSNFQLERSFLIFDPYVRIRLFSMFSYSLGCQILLHLIYQLWFMKIGFNALAKELFEHVLHHVLFNFCNISAIIGHCNKIWSSKRKCFIKKAFKNFAIFTGKHLGKLFTSFSLVTSINFETSPPNFLNLVLPILQNWWKTSRLYLTPVPNHWTRTKTTAQKKIEFSGQILRKLKLRLWRLLS